MASHIGGDIPYILTHVAKWQSEVGIFKYAGQYEPPAFAYGIIAAVYGVIAVEPLGRYRWAYEDEIVIVKVAFEQADKHRIVESLSQFRLTMAIKQPHVMELDLLPQLRIEYVGIRTAAQLGNRFAHTRIVQTYTANRSMPAGHPFTANEVIPGLSRSGPEDVKVIVEAAQDGVRDLTHHRKMC